MLTAFENGEMDLEPHRLVNLHSEACTSPNSHACG